MSAIGTSGIVFACIFGATLLGLFLRSILPEHHRSPESRNVVNLGIGQITTMAAMVLSLLIASAKGSYDAQGSEITQFAANVALLDRVLGHYGPEAREARDLLRSLVVRMLDQMWPKSGPRPAELDPRAAPAESLYDTIHALSPQSENQRSLRVEALKITADLVRMRWLVYAQARSRLPRDLLIVLVIWAAVISVSVGLYAPPNGTVVATLFVCALSLSAAIFLILELAEPFQGFIRVSSAPLRLALGLIGQ